MGNILEHYPVVLILPAFSRHDAALDWARQKAIEHFGPVALQSERFEFTETDYYEATMGADLRIQLFALERLIDPARIADDGARAAEAAALEHGADLPGFLRSSDHGRRLTALGFEADLDLAAEVDRFDVVPELRDGLLTAIRPGAATTVR